MFLFVALHRPTAHFYFYFFEYIEKMSIPQSIVVGNKTLKEGF